MTMTRLMLAAALAAGISLPAWADTRLIPVEGHVELEGSSTSLTLDVPWREYGMDLDAFTAAAEDPVEQAFAALIGAFRDEDVEALDRHLAAPGPRDKIIEFWNQAFNRFENLTVVGRSTLGGVDTIFWETPTDKGPFLRAFAFTETDGVWKGDMVGSNRAMLTLIMHSLEAEEESTAGALALPLSVSGSDVNVPLTFNGEAVEFDVWSDDLSAAGEVLAFYAGSWRMLRDGADEPFIARHTAGSAGKMAEQLQPGRGEGFRQTRTMPRVVWLVMEADPLVYLFYTEGQAAARPDAPIRVDTLVRTEDGLRLTNFYYASHIDQVFQTAIPQTRGALMEALERR